MHTGNGGGSAAASALPPMPLLPITSKQTVHNCKDYVPTNDVFIASYPKSGTTWLQNVLYQLISKTELPLSHISDYAPFYEVDRTWEGSQIAPHYREGHTRLGRAIFNTHLRWDMMPTDGCPDARYIYVVRNAKDACVSFYHHLTNQTLEDGGYEGSWDMFVEDWCAGNVPFGSWVDHLLSWSEALKDPRVLLLQYEDLKTDLEGCVRKIMAHCDLTLTPTQLETALSRMSFEYMSKNHELYQPRSVVWKDPSFRFIRKGQVGDHRAMFEDRHHERFANMLQDRLGGAEPPQLIKSKV